MPLRRFGIIHKIDIILPATTIPPTSPIMKEIIKALQNTFSDKKYLFIFGITAFVVFALMSLIPVYAIPGNTLEFQLTLFDAKDYILFIFLAILSSLVLTIQTRIIYQKIKVSHKASALSTAGIFSGIISSVFASATCGLCVVALFGFLGSGAILFIIENRVNALMLAIGLLLFSLYLSSRNYNKGCELCIIETPKSQNTTNDYKP